MFQSPASAVSRAPLRWISAALMLGAAAGGASVWWGMRGRIDAEAQRIARVLSESAATPRVPGPPGLAGSAVAASSVASGGAVPVIAVTDDLEKAFRDLLAIGDPAARHAALAHFLDRLPVDRWPGFLLAVKKVGERGEFDDQPGSFMAALGMMESVFSLMMRRAPEHLLNNVMESRPGQEENNDSERDDEVAIVAFRFWAGQDLPAAMAYFESNFRDLPPGEQSEAAKGLAREFVKSDPAGAFKWIKSLPAETQAQVAHGAFQTLSHIDSPAALRFLVTEKELPNRAEFAQQMAKGWAATEPENALAWAKQLPDDLAARAVQGAMEHLAEKDFAAAVREIPALAPAQQDAALKEIADNINDDPSRATEALRLVEASSEGAGRAEAARHALAQWTRRDPEAASAWVAAQPEGATRDASIQGFGRSAVETKSDPVAGLEWTATMSNPKQRTNWLRENIQAWAGYDPASARQWVESSARLNEVDREGLLPLTRKE